MVSHGRWKADIRWIFESFNPKADRSGLLVAIENVGYALANLPECAAAGYVYIVISHDRNLAITQLYNRLLPDNILLERFLRLSTSEEKPLFQQLLNHQLPNPDTIVQAMHLYNEFQQPAPR